MTGISWAAFPGCAAPELPGRAASRCGAGGAGGGVSAGVSEMLHKLAAVSARVRLRVVFSLSSLRAEEAGQYMTPAGPARSHGMNRSCSPPGANQTWCQSSQPAPDGSKRLTSACPAGSDHRAGSMGRAPGPCGRILAVPWGGQAVTRDRTFPVLCEQSLCPSRTRCPPHPPVRVQRPVFPAPSSQTV